MTAFRWACLHMGWLRGSDACTDHAMAAKKRKLTLFLHKRTPLVCRAPRAFLIRFLIFLDIIDHVNVYCSVVL